MIDDNHNNFNLWKVLLVIARRKKFIITFVVICTLGAVATAFILPKWYRAKASVLPSQYEQMSGISGSFNQFAVTSAGFELPLMATPSDVYATMLRSETIVRAVINDHNLNEYFDIKLFHECFLYMQDQTKIKVTPAGVVEIYFVDKDPEMAARVANSYVTQLDRLNRKVKVGKAKSDREFVYQHLLEAKSNLDSVRTALLEFQMTNKAVDLEKQQELTLTAASELKTRLATRLVDLDIKKVLYSETHSTVRQLEREVREIRNQLKSLEVGQGELSFLNLPLSKIPELSLRFSSLQTDITLYENVFVMLTELYEEARIKEQRDTPTISILEKAWPPEIKHRPQRALIVLASFFCSLVLALFIALFADYLENLRRISPDDFELMGQARREITGKSGYSDS